MKKLTLLITLLSTITFGQIQYPIAPGCEQFSEKIDRINCFNTYTVDLLKSYFNLYGNANNYFRLRTFQETVKFQIGTNGEYRFKALDSQSVLLNKVAADVFYAFNRVQEHANKKIVPAKSADGRPAILSFNLPINYVNDKDYINDIDKKPILFTLENGEYTVRLDQDFTFNIYNKNNELVRTINSIMEFYFVDILKPLTLQSKNLIVEKNEKGKMIKLEVENLFKNYQGDLKISYFENDNLIKEYLTMKDFLNSSHSNYIY